MAHKVDRIWSTYPERKGRIHELAGRIRPVKDVDGEKYYYQYCDPIEQSFSWEEGLGEKAEKLVPLRDITTYHTYGYYGFFKPSQGEVIAQIPEGDLEKVIAFEIIESPQDYSDLNKHYQELQEGYHVAKVRLYTKEPGA